MNTCQTCKYWVQNPRQVRGDPSPNHGQCLAAPHVEGYEQPERTEAQISELPMITHDGSGYFAKLSTHKDHSCTQWGE